MTKALDRLQGLLADVDNLMEYHPGAGRPAKDAGPLLRSCVVLTYAAWEVYAEDSLIWAADECSKVKRFSELPASMKSFAAASVASDPAALADDGWREVLTKAVKVKVQGDEKDSSKWGLNTAGPAQVNALHDSILGAKLLNRCSWRGKGNSAVKSDLAELVRVRGSIVHTGATPGDLNLAGARAWRDFVRRLAQGLDEQLEVWVAEL